MIDGNERSVIEGTDGVMAMGLPTQFVQSSGATTWLAGADYLILRPSFSNSTALLVNTRSGGAAGRSSLDAVNYNFDFSGGLRAFLGYQATADDVFRFTYTNFFSQTGAAATATGNWAGGDGSIVLGPYDTNALSAGASITSRVRVNLNVYDLDWARRLDFDKAGRRSAWDAAAGAGVRFLSTQVDSGLFNNNVPGFTDVFVTTRRSFGGVGPRLFGQVRRYFGENRRWSGFGAIGGSLLVGSLSNVDGRFAVDPQVRERQVTGSTTIVPNVDISLGGSWQIRPRTNLSAGWMLMYFGTLGYSETVPFDDGTTNYVTNAGLTTSNLLFDGFFLRFTHSF